MFLFFGTTQNKFLKRKLGLIQIEGYKSFICKPLNTYIIMSDKTKRYIERFENFYFPVYNSDS